MMRQNSLEGEYQIVLPSKISSSIARTIVDARSFYTYIASLDTGLCREVRSKKLRDTRSMVMLKEVI